MAYTIAFYPEQPDWEDPETEFNEETVRQRFVAIAPEKIRSRFFSADRSESKKSGGGFYDRKISEKIGDKLNRNKKISQEIEAF